MKGQRTGGLAVPLVLFIVCLTATADDFHFQAAGPVGLTYVGMYYGLMDPNGSSWYPATDILGGVSTTWLAVVDTGASACLLGATTRDQYDSPGIPLQPYPAVKFTDEGFGGTEDFSVTKPLRLMLAGQAAVDPNNTEDHSVFTAYGPVGASSPPSMTLAVSRRPTDPNTLDVDIIGMSILEGRVLRVDPQHLELLRWALLTAAGSLGDTPPPPGPKVLYVPVSMQDFFPTAQAVDVGKHAMLPMHLRNEASDPYATRTAFFDSGSPVNFVSESFAVAAGIDPNDPNDLTIPVQGIGPGVTYRPGYYVDALALELGNGRAGDNFVISNTAVFIIPDANMPGGLDAILGTGVFSHSSWLVETTVDDWYLDTRDPNSAYLVVALPEPATPAILALVSLAMFGRRRARCRT